MITPVEGQRSRFGVALDIFYDLLPLLVIAALILYGVFGHPGGDSGAGGTWPTG